MRRYPPYYVKRFEYLEKHYLNATNYYYNYYFTFTLYLLKEMTENEFDQLHAGIVHNRPVVDC